jgi:co-chaperonin GroES (HSP10)
LNEGFVVAVGKGALNKEGKHIPTQVAVGDKIILPPYGGSPVKVLEEVKHFLLCYDFCMLTHYSIGIPFVP